jgi:hypothetical protein
MSPNPRAANFPVIASQEKVRAVGVLPRHFAERKMPGPGGAGKPFVVKDRRPIVSVPLEIDYFEEQLSTIREIRVIMVMIAKPYKITVPHYPEGTDEPNRESHFFSCPCNTSGCPGFEHGSGVRIVSP